MIFQLQANLQPFTVISVTSSILKVSGCRAHVEHMALPDLLDGTDAASSSLG
ncbi:MAG: hypothetical protein OXE85_03735 [Roseovarius sp.]|nr:hypothetical protein [Roseovarius sp.]